MHFCHFLDELSPTQAASTFRLEYSKLYETLCNTLRDDQTTLLLYLLIHQNAGMKAFILSRTNIDALVSLCLVVTTWSMLLHMNWYFVACSHSCDGEEFKPCYTFWSPALWNTEKFCFLLVCIIVISVCLSCEQVLPLLRILYGAQERNSHHIYMALIILLVLSEDDLFNKAVHEIVSVCFPIFVHT